MTTKNFKARIGIQAPLVAAEDGTTAITLSGDDVTVIGDLTVNNNLDVKGSADLGNTSGDTISINGTTTVYNGLTIGSSSGDNLTVNSTVTDNITFTDNSTTTVRGVTGVVGANDYWQFGGGAAGSSAGYAVIATGDNGTEPIYVQQYNGASIANQVTLLDASGNTIIGGDLTVTGTNINTGANDTIIQIDRTTTDTNSTTRALVLRSTCTGTPAVGIGTALGFQVHTGASTFKDAAFIDVTATDVTGATEDFTMGFGLMQAGGAYAQKMELDGAGNLQIDGDLTVTGNDIKSSSATALTLSGADVAVAGDLTVTGNDIKSSSATALTLSGADVTVAGDLAINGTTLTLDANNTGAGADLSIIANRGSSGTDAVLQWSESTGFWTFNKDLYVSEQIIGGSTLGLNGNTINFNNEDGATLADCFITVKKPGVGDPQIKWNETTDRWQTTVDSSTYINIPDQNLETTSDVAFGSVNADITDGSYVLGQLIATPTTAYVPPASALSTLSGSNGLAIASSTGYGAAIAIRYHSGDTTAGTNSAASVVMSGASGTSTAPGGIALNQVAGNINIDGYTAGTSNNFAQQIATINQGAGTTAITPLQIQGYARQAFTNSVVLTTTVTGASGTGSVATLTFTTQNTAPYTVGQTVAVAGMTPAGYNNAAAVITAATTSSISYANTTTGFTSGGTIAAVNTVTAAGMGFRIRGFANSTNMTAANRFNFIDLTASAAAFKSNAYTFANEVITGSTLTATNYMTLGATTGSINQDTFTVKNTAGTSTYGTLGATTGSINQDTFTIKNTAATTTYGTFTSTGTTISGAGLSQITRTTVGTPTVVETRPSMNIQLTRSDQAAPTSGDGTGFRSRVAGSNGTNYTMSDLSSNYSSTGDYVWSLNLANGDQTGATFASVTTINSKVSATTISAGTPSATPGASTVAAVAVFSPTGAAVTGNITATGTIGYTTGAGGTVTQATSRTTGVTLNKSTGAITLFSDAGTTTATTFTVTNSTVAATDVIILNQKSGTDLYDLMVTAVAGGSFNITFRTTGGVTTEQPVFNFAVIKGIAA